MPRGWRDVVGHGIVLVAVADIEKEQRQIVQ
jgi:hypothetical protein